MKERAISTDTRTRPITAADFQELAQAHLDGLASDEDVAVLEEHDREWVLALRALRDEADATLQRVRSNVTGPERDLVIADFEEERERIVRALAELTGEPVDDEADSDEDESDEGDDGDTADDQAPGVAQLQLSVDGDQVVAWAAGDRADPASLEQLKARLEAAGAPRSTWVDHDPVRIPGGREVDAVAAPVHDSLGWLVSVGTSGDDDEIGPSVLWLGLVAALAVRVVAQGRMVPQLEKVGGESKGGRASYAVRWIPVLIDHSELVELAKGLPGTVSVCKQQRDPRAVTQQVLSTFVDAICRDAAARIEVPAPPPKPRSAVEVAESVLGRLDGTPFDAPQQHGNEVGRGLQRWSKRVTGTSKLPLILQLDPPDDGNAWHLHTLATDGQRKPEPVDAAMSNASNSRRDIMKSELERLESLYPPLERAKATRRGQVILSQDEAWAFMTERGPVLVAAGFDVRVPPLSRKKPSAGLRLTSIGGDESVVGAQQLTSVRWSAVFGDVELGADDIQRLASESRPLVKAHGRWVEVDKADLEAAAAALAEREKQGELTGAQMLRYALGLEQAPLAGGVQVAGRGWAVDLLSSARSVPRKPPTRPEGFEGELRGYQADALAWLEFLDGAGLGGVLALDMGLGKTPTMLAHLRATTDQGPALVIAPPAVVGNWASEARRFTPELDIVVHHGANRTDTDQLAKEVGEADLIITTYGTAVRDIGALDEIQWGKVVLDEAQVIKNPASETAQQLRRLQSRTRVVLTGTPIENGLGDLWALMDFVNPGLVGERSTFVAQLSKVREGSGSAEQALRMLNGVLVFRRTKAEPIIAAELPDRIDELDHCPMTPEQVGLYQAILDDLVAETSGEEGAKKKGAVLAAITALKQVCNHPAAYTRDDEPLDGRSGKLARLNEIVDYVFEAGERLLIFTHFASWGERLADHLTKRTGVTVSCYHGGLARGARDRMVEKFQKGEGPGALVLSLKAGGTGLNLTAASHVVLYDRWWNPAVEDQARDRAWRIGQDKTVVAHRLVCPGTVDERVEEVVAGKRKIAELVLPKSSSVDDLDTNQLQTALGLDADALLTDEFDDDTHAGTGDAA